MAIASSADNIRYNGTGIAYAAEVGSPHPGVDLGELDGFAFNQSVTKSQITSTRNAARGVIMEAVDKTEATLTFGLKEQTEENLKMALMASAVNSENQLAGHVFQDTKTWIADQYIDMGKLDVFSTRLSHGAVTDGPFAVGDTVTQASPAASGKVAYVDSGFIEVVNVTGTFTVGQAITSSAKTATLSGVTVKNDAVITSADGATRRSQGTDYTIVPKAGFVRKLSSGDLVDADKVSFDHPALNRKILHGLSTNTVLRKVTFVTDPDDHGPRKRVTFHKVNLSPDGEMTLMGDGEEILKISGSVIKDTNQQAGEEYYKVEIFG